jgi:hypothetical protein
MAFPELAHHKNSLVSAEFPLLILAVSGFSIHS